MNWIFKKKITFEIRPQKGKFYKGFLLWNNFQFWYEADYLIVIKYTRYIDKQIKKMDGLIITREQYWLNSKWNEKFNNKFCLLQFHFHKVTCQHELTWIIQNQTDKQIQKSEMLFFSLSSIISIIIIWLDVFFSFIINFHF